MEVLANEIYTAQETLSLLKISKSTFLRLIKKGMLSACKVGGQYRVLGSEILRLFHPKVQEGAAIVYERVIDKVAKKLEKVE